MIGLKTYKLRYKYMRIEISKGVKYFVIEFGIWIGIAFIVGYRVIFAAIYGYFNRILYENYFDVLILSIVILFPFLFNLIYTEFPFQYLRNRRIKNLSEKDPISTDESMNENKKENAIIGNRNSKTISTSNDTDILSEYLRQSRKLSELILSRSSAYLLIGCLIAFAGVVFFYFQSLSTHLDPKSLSSELTFTVRETLPRFGVLIFVETIAFFFLRQFKSTMEEFRYYESIKRQRENQFLVASYGNSHKDNLDYLKNIIELLNLNENPSKLSKDETTQILENQKLLGPESDVIGKFIDLLNIIKK